MIGSMRKTIVLSLLLYLTASAQATVPPTIEFTPQEKAYIERADAIKMCVDPDWWPFEQINPQGQHEGIAADLVQLVAQRVGLR